MDRKVHLCLLILCGIMFQEICTLSGKNEKSEDLQIRKKRLIGSNKIAFQSAPYAVKILANGFYHCVASLLSPEFAITAAHCLMDPLQPEYSMVSSTLKLAFGMNHNITDVIRHPGYHSEEDPHDLSLFKFFPHINFKNSRNQPIKLYNGHYLAPNTSGTVASWGYHAIKRGEAQLPKQLRAASMTIISLNECRRFYRNSRFVIMDHFICTFDNGEKRCEDGDSGAALVVNGELVGVMSWNQDDCFARPQIFMNMLLRMYRDWIAGFVPGAVQYGSGR